MGVLVAYRIENTSVKQIAAGFGVFKHENLKAIPCDPERYFSFFQSKRRCSATRHRVQNLVTLATPVAAPMPLEFVE